MPKFLVVLSLLSVTATGAAFAAEGQHSGTDQEQKACARDVTKFCRPLMDQGDLVILGCLQQNRPKISTDCNKVLVSHGQ
jgi:hypothetical protein